MKIVWLEKHAAEGLIRREVLDNIYTDVEKIIKTGSVDKHLSEMSDMLLNGVAMAAGAGAAGFAGKKLEEARGRKTMSEAREAISNDPTFAQMKEKARARFDEIALIAPHVAMNKPLIKKLIQSKLENGLSDQDVQSLALIQAQHMPEVLRNKNFMPKMASVSPAKLGEITADVYLLKEAAAIGLSPKINKYIKHIAMHTAIPLLIGAGGGALNFALAKLDQRKLKAELDKSFETAVGLSSKDNEPLHDHKEKARQAFQSLAHFAPHVALEPQAARAFMTKIVSYDQGMNVDDVRALSEIQKNMSGSKKPSPFAMGFETTGRFTNTPSSMQKAVETASDQFVSDLNG